MRRGPTRHMFVEDPDNVDPIDRMQWCSRCNLPAQNSVHQLPDVSEEQRDNEARRTGERRHGDL